MNKLLNMPAHMEPDERARWLVRLRWLALALTLAAVLVFNAVMPDSLPMPALLATIGALILCNLALSFYVHQLQRSKDERKGQWFVAHIHI